MKARISALMDGELERREAAGPLEALRAEGEARDAWRSFHLIGDAMRDAHLLSPGFAARVAARLEQEPTVMAPSRLLQRPEQRRWQLLSAAASVAAIALVGWLAFEPQSEPSPVPPVAKVAPPTQVQPPDSAHDYLYAHQGYSPRNSLQGVAPYVRTVSGEAVVGKR